MTFILFILGLVGLILDEQFTHQHTLGWVFIGIAVTIWLLTAILATFATVLTSDKEWDKINRRGRL
jgi:hypothetical protein